jgi:AcrR family transcriptional regulator
MERDGAPDWHGWHGNPDDLWPPFGDPSRLASPGRADRRGDVRGDQLAGAARRRGQDPARRDAGHDRARPRLSREEIVDAAIAIADAEGADALSMRRIAQVLRAGTMSLYWHVSGKEHLLDLMRDVLMAEVAVPEPTGDWQADLRTYAVNSRNMLRRHLWLMDFVGGRPPLGPATLLGIEAMLTVLDVLPVSSDVHFRILESVNTYVTGTVLREAQEIRTQQAEQQAEAEYQGDIPAERAAWRNRLDVTGLFPRFVRFLDQGIDPDAPETTDARFEFGLDCLLSGIAARLSR